MAQQSGRLDFAVFSRHERRTPPARSYYRPAYPTFDYGWGFSPGYENFARQNAEIRGIQRAARGW